MIRFAAVLALTTVAALTGCGSDGTAPAPGPSSLVGTTFLSTGITGAPIPGGGPLEVTFPNPGRIAATAGCNRHLGEVTFDGTTMTAGPLASTMMACPGPRGEADAWITDFFAAPLDWSTPSRTTLVLGRGEGRDRRTVTLTERRNTPLTGTAWTVTALVTAQAVESSRALDESRPHLTLAGDGAVSGFTGCNDFHGAAQVSGDKIVFTAIAAAEKTCGDELTRIEQVVLDTLRGSVTYRIDGDQLALTNDADPNVGLRLSAG